MKLSEKIKSVTDLTIIELDVIFYNLDNNRDDAQVSKELHAFAKTNPDIIGLCETIGNRLVPLKGYRLIKSDDNSGTPRSKARKNVSAYVSKKYKVTDIEWIDCVRTWPRTQGEGTHEPRSYLKFRVNGILVIVAHQPQKPIGDDRLKKALFSARAEGIEKLAHAMAVREGKTARALFSRLRPKILMSDFNGTLGESQGPHILAGKIGGKVYNGKRIDNFVVRGAISLIGEVRIFSNISGVTLRSDHHHAIRAKFKVSRFWVLRRKKS